VPSVILVLGKKGLLWPLLLHIPTGLSSRNCAHLITECLNKGKIYIFYKLYFMTVINGIEIDAIEYKNEVKYAIQNNLPLEEKLNIVLVISNPCLYGRRYKLLNDFVARMDIEEHVRLFVVEMIYPGQDFKVTSSKNPNHLQLKQNVVIWSKENMINLAVKHLLPKEYKCFAWVDADLEFESTTFAMDALKILNGSRDVVQLFSHCVDMDKEELTMTTFSSFGYNYSKQKIYSGTGKDFWHPGYAWAITRTAYEKIGGIYDKGILGSGDKIMALSFINKVEYMHHPKYHPDYNNSMTEYQKKAKTLRLGYVPGVILHHYHGSKENRRYTERWNILINHQYTPQQMYYQEGILKADLSPEFKKELLHYFSERKEDD
jgi:hypothetical protein